jgi:hypothetical protein
MPGGRRPRPRRERATPQAGAAAEARRAGAEAAAILGEVDRLGAGAEEAAAGGLEAAGEPSGVWPPNWTMTPRSRRCAPRASDLEHVLEGERLEVEAVRGVVVGGDGLGVAVDHDGLEAGFAQGEGGVDAAVVELDALADPVGAAAEDDDLAAIADPGLVLLFVGGVEVGGVGGELGGAGVDAR